MTSLPALQPQFLVAPDRAKLEPHVCSEHAPRILLLYGSLRERSFSRLLVEEAARMMGTLQVRRLPVLNRDKRLVGIVSLGDLAVTKAKPAGDALKSISKAPPN